MIIKKRERILNIFVYIFYVKKTNLALFWQLNKKSVAKWLVGSLTYDQIFDNMLYLQQSQVSYLNIHSNYNANQTLLYLFRSVKGIMLL